MDLSLGYHRCDSSKKAHRRSPAGTGAVTRIVSWLTGCVNSTHREWSEMLGEHVARYSSDAVFRNGELSVRILSSVLRNDLYMQRTLLVEKLNVRLGKKIVTSIRFR